LYCRGIATALDVLSSTVGVQLVVGKTVIIFIHALLFEMVEMELMFSLLESNRILFMIVNKIKLALQDPTTNPAAQKCRKSTSLNYSSRPNHA